MTRGLGFALGSGLGLGLGLESELSPLWPWWLLIPPSGGLEGATLLDCGSGCGRLVTLPLTLPLPLTLTLTLTLP